MFVFGLLIIFCMALLLLVEIINEILKGGPDQSLARIIDRFDRWIDKKMGRGE
jgi:hypothetical protein